MGKINCFFVILCALLSASLFVSCASSVNNGSSSGGSNPIVYPAGVYVATNGNDANTGLTKSDPLLNIQLAISTAMYAGLSNVYVQEGYYTTNAGLPSITINAFASGMTVYGGCDSTFTPQAGHYSMLDAQNTMTNIIEVKDVSNFTLNGLVITGSSNRVASSKMEVALFMTNTYFSSITNCIFVSNKGYIGGALVMYNSDDNTVCAVFSDNSAYYAAGFFLYSSSLNKILSSFSNNISSISVGALGLDSDCVSNFISGKFINNQCAGSSGIGGALYTWGQSSNTIVSNCLFVGNRAPLYGGAVGLTGPSLRLLDSVFSNNYAGSMGGACYITLNSFISNCIISSNTVTNVGTTSGAGLAIYGNGIIIDTCVIRDNSSTNTAFGGGIYIYQTYDSFIRNTIISNNVSTSKGGGIYMGYNTSNNLFYNCVIRDNRLTNSGLIGMGGGIYMEGNSNAVVSCLIMNNSTSDIDDMGGGLFIAGTNSLIKWSRISNNYSPYGGGIYSSNINVYNELYENEIANNQALFSGGGVYINRGILMQYNNVSGNSSVNSAFGAGIYAENAWGTLYINTIGSNYNSVYGNGIYIKNSSLTNTQNHFINDSINIGLEGNTAAGGLVFNGNWISGTSIYNSSIAIFEYGSDTTNHTFTGNHFVTNRMGWPYRDFMTNHVQSGDAWTNINIPNFYGASTANGNDVTVW